MQREEATGAWLSADGAWRWDGRAWVPNQLAQQRPLGRLGFGDVVSLPSRDPRWLGKCGIEGLIALIPIYGGFEILGWALTYLDNLRAGRAELPEGRFGYAGRGFGTAVVGLVYGVLGGILFYSAFFGLLFLVAGSAPQGRTGDAGASGAGAAFPALFIAGFFGLQASFFLLYALVHFLVVPVILRSERHGIAGGLNLFAAVRMVADNPRAAAVAAVLVFLAAFIASLGVYACLVGVVFSYGYGAAMLGATVRWYEERLLSAEG